MRPPTAHLKTRQRAPSWAAAPPRHCGDSRRAAPDLVQRGRELRVRWRSSRSAERASQAPRGCRGCSLCYGRSEKAEVHRRQRQSVVVDACVEEGKTRSLRSLAWLAPLALFFLKTPGRCLHALRLCVCVCVLKFRLLASSRVTACVCVCVCVCVC